MKPNLKMMYGLTHDMDGNAIVRVPKVVKVQIGQPKGPDVAVYIAADDNWRVLYNGKLRAYAGKDRAQAEAAYRDCIASATEGTPPKLLGTKAPKCEQRRFPSKLPYFTFSKQNGDGTYEPDWDAIEAHGHCPTEIEIVFVDNAPFQAQYQMWSASELLCTGDGLTAERNAVKLPGGHEAAAQAALKAHQKMFPIVNGCHACGCAYAQPGEKNGKPTAPACKPHGRLQFQLVSSLRLGGTAQFDTTSFRSVSQIFSCLQQFLAFTGNGDANRGWLAGIPLLMCLRKFKHSQGNAYAVSLEFRAESVTALRTKIIEAGSSFRAAIDMVPPAPAAAVPPARQITAGGQVEAREMTSEFYDDLPDAEDGAPKAGDMAAATATREGALVARLAAAKATASPVVEAEIVTEDMVEESEENDANEDYDPTRPIPPAATDGPSEAEMQAATIAADKADKEKEAKRGRR